MRTFLLFLLVLAHRLPGRGSHTKSTKTFSPEAAESDGHGSKARVCSGQVQLPLQRTVSLQTRQAQTLGGSVT